MMQLNKSKLTKKQKKIINSLEGIGDILVYNTKNFRKNDAIKNGLERIESIIQELFNIKEKNLEKFNSIMFTPEALETNEKSPKENH